MNAIKWAKMSNANDTLKELFNFGLGVNLRGVKHLQQCRIMHNSYKVKCMTPSSHISKMFRENVCCLIIRRAVEDLKVTGLVAIM